MPWPQDNFAEFLRQQIEANKGKKPKFEQWSYSRKGGEPRPYVSDEEYVPGTYGYIPRMQGTLKLPPYAQQERLSTPVTKRPRFDQEIAGTAQAGRATQQFAGYKDRLDNWLNTYYRLQFANDDYQGEYLPGITVPGPNGDTLDKYPGAIGWDRRGDPYYGKDIGGWMTKFYNQVRYPYGTPKEEDNRNMFAVSGGKVSGVSPDAYKYSPTIFGSIGRAAANIGSTALLAYDEPAKAAERGMNIPAQVAGFGEEGYQVPGAGEVTPQALGEQRAALTEGAEYTPDKQLPWLLEQAAPRYDLGKVWRNYVENFGDIWKQNMYRSPTSVAYNFLRNSLLKSPGELKDDVAEGWQAGNILYSSFIDPVIREEFTRRAKSGENPELLTQELENPWAEMAGRMVFDPLNWAGVGMLKPARDAMRREKAIKQSFTLSPEVEKVISKLDTLSRVTGRADVSIPAKIDDLKAASNFTELAQAVSNDFLTHGEKLAKRADDYAPWALTASSKRHQVARNMGEWWGRVLTDTANDGDAVESLQALYQIAYGAKKGDLDMVATGLTGLNHLPNPIMGLSNDGKDIGNMLYHLLGDDPGKFFTTMQKKAREGLPALTDYVGRKMDDALTLAFPDVSAKVKAGQKVPMSIQVLSRFHNDVAQKAYKPLNSFFAGVYMTLSPGYAFRNMSNNVFTEVIDEGLGTLRGSPEAKLAELNEYLGGVIPGGVGGFSSGTQGIDNVYEGIKKGFSGVAGRMEYEDSIRVVHAAVTKTLRKMMKPGRAIPEVDSLVAAGMPRDVADMLPGLVIKHKSNINAAYDEVIQMAADGEAWALSTLDFMGNKADKLADFEMDSQILAILADAQKTGDAETAITRIEALWKNTVKGMEDNLRKTVPVVDETAEGADIAVAMMGATQKGDVTDDLANAMHYTQANSNSIQAYRDAVGDLPPEIEDVGKQAYLDRITRRDTAWRMRDLSFDESFDIAAAWKRLGMVGDAPGDVKAFRRAVWTEYYFVPVRKAMQEYRDLVATTAERMFKESGDTLNPGLFAQARKHYTLAQSWDDVMRKDEVRLGLWKAINRGDARNAAFMYGEQFGIGNESHLLAAINKYGDKKYGSLAGIPIDDLKPGGAVENSLIQRLRVKAGLVPEPGAIKAAEVVATPPAAQADEATLPVGVTDELREEQGKEANEIRQQLINKYYKMDRQEMNFKAPELEEAMLNELQSMYAEMDVGVPKSWVWSEADNKYLQFPSTYTDWYKNTYKSAGGKERLRKAFNKLFAGQGLDRGKTVENLRSIALARVLYESDDPIALWNIGLRNEAVYRMSVKLQDEFFDLNDIAGRKGFDELFDAVGKYDKTGLYPEPDKAQYVEALRKLEELGKQPPLPPSAKNAPTTSRALYEQKDGIQDTLNELYDAIRQRWNTYTPTVSNNDITKALNDWKKVGNTRMSEARLIAQKVGNAARDFTLLDYNGKRYFDLALAYALPYHFWYNRSYAHWLQRLVYNPEILAGYAKYKEAMTSAHAGAPEWWRYNVNTNDLLGMDAENPLYFNLEATLWPLNGVTGVDFTDSNKRTGWLSAAVDDLGKMGPSVWTPISMAMALGMKIKGEDDAAERWGGRLIPQTATLKSALNLMNVNVPTRQGVNEFDPNVQLFSEGLDPYERRRALRALWGMVEEGALTYAQAIDVSKAQSGPMWQQAIIRAQDSRSLGQLSSFAFGVGFKSRNETDMQIDMFDQDWRLLWANSNNLSPEEMRIQMDDLRDKYPFGDLVLIGRKSGIDRDRSLGYNIIGRIPPGQKDDLAEMVGIDPRLFDKFYEDKGRMDKWATTDYDKFMAGLVEISAVLDLPDSAIRAEWTDAKNAYTELNEQVEAQFGEGINAQIDIFYNKRKADQDAAYEWLEQQPNLQEAMDYKEQQLIYDPRMAPYYASIDKIENYYRSRMYDTIEDEMGAGVWDLLEQWGKIKDRDQKLSNSFWKAKGLDRYSTLEEIYSKAAAEATAQVAKMLQPARFPNLRDDVGDMGLGAQDLLQQLGSPAQTPYEYSWQDWQSVIPTPSAQRLLVDYFNGEELSYSMQQRIDRMAGELDIDPDVALELMKQSYVGR